MPRKSKKAKFIEQLKSCLSRRIKARAVRSLVDEEDSIEDVKDLAYLATYKNCVARRYIFRRSSYRKAVERFSQDLEDESAIAAAEEEDEDSAISAEGSRMPWLTDDEFLQKYRCTRESFGRLLGLIKNHEVFNCASTSKKKGRKQAPVAHQLMVFLKFLGTEGSGGSNSNQRHVFSIGYGTAAVYRKRVTKAVLSLREPYVFWPDEEERTCWKY